MAAGAGLSEYTALPYGAGHPGLEPGIAGFGDLCLLNSQSLSQSHFSLRLSPVAALVNMAGMGPFGQVASSTWQEGGRCSASAFARQTVASRVCGAFGRLRPQMTSI